MSSDYIVERRMKRQKLRRQARRSGITVRRLYKFVRFIFIILIIYSVYRCFNLHYWYLGHNLYNDKTRLEILGNNIVSKERVISEMKKIPIENIPLYKINPAKIANQIESLSPVKRAYVRRFWFPARLVVMIEEVNPALIIAPSENAPDVAVLSHNGELVGREFLPLKNTNNTVKILSFGNNGDDYEKWDKEKINTLYRLKTLLEDYSKEKVIYIDLRNPHNAYAQLESVKIQLGELDPSVFERIKSIYYILPEIKNSQLDKEIKYVDLSWREAKYLKM